MGNRLRLKLSCFLAMILFAGNIYARTGGDQIVGEWISEQKNFAVQIIKDGNNFKAILIWFDDSDDPSRPMAVRTDYKNPDKSLRNRKLIGMNLIRNLTYSQRTNSWEDGMIYDAKNGREWNACIKTEPDGSIRVTGYWHFKFIGRSMRFTRLTPSDRMLVSR